jgi:uncharacterized protein
MLIEMQIAHVVLDPATNMPIVILKDTEEKHALPIWIGVLEASAIVTELEGIKLPRPMTHDLMQNMLDELGAQIARIVVTDLQENTYYARIVMTLGDQEYSIDARPSDSLALALRTDAKILVDEKVIAESRTFDNIGATELTDGDDMEKMLEDLDPEAFGKYKM